MQVHADLGSFSCLSGTRETDEVRVARHLVGGEVGRLQAVFSHRS